MHDAATLIESDVIGENAGNLDVEEGMLKLHAFELTAFVGAEDIGLLDIAIGL